MGYSPWGRKESDTTERLHLTLPYFVLRASLVAQMVKNLPAVWETQVQSLGWEDPLEWQPTPVFLPGDFHGQRSLVDFRPRGPKSQTQPSD